MEYPIPEGWQRGAALRVAFWHPSGMQGIL